MHYFRRRSPHDWAIQSEAGIARIREPKIRREPNAVRLDESWPERIGDKAGTRKYLSKRRDYKIPWEDMVACQFREMVGPDVGPVIEETPISNVLEAENPGAFIRIVLGLEVGAERPVCDGVRCISNQVTKLDPFP